jgi:CMP-N-acetylneuraminic acid synthetase
MVTLCLIPARGGSRGVPGKNLALVGGRPLLDWTVDAAAGAGPPARVVVTTDAEDIAERARALGAEVPFLRPPELAADDTPGIAPILHAVETLAAEGYQPDLVVCLQPTSPLRGAEDVRAALALFADDGVDAVVSVSPARRHPLWMKTIDSGGWLRPFSAEPAPPTRQALPPVYALNGAIYAARRDVLLETRGWYTDRTRAYVMPPDRSWDVDTPFDLVVAASSPRRCSKSTGAGSAATRPVSSSPRRASTTAAPSTRPWSSSMSRCRRVPTR